MAQERAWLGHDQVGLKILTTKGRRIQVWKSYRYPRYRINGSEGRRATPAGTQGISPGDFDDVVRAMDAGATYVVVHTKAQPTGELRGQIPRRLPWRGSHCPNGHTEL